MGKVLKYCSSCEEGFAERFEYCPNCGTHLQAFELNPLAAEAKPVVEEPREEVVAPAPVFLENSLEAEKVEVVETVAFSANETQEEEFEETFETPEAEFEEEPEIVAAATAAAASGNGYHYQPAVDQATFNHSGTDVHYKDDGYRITVIEEKGVKQRNMLLLGSMCLILSLAIGGVLYSLFNHQLGVGAIDQGELFAYVPEIEEQPMETEKPQKKDDDDGGGGGGGGKENPEPPSKGRLPTQVDKPINPPMPLPQMSNPSLPYMSQTQGNIKREPTDEPIGSPVGAISGKFSSGPGSGGGIGTGIGTGVGSGRGTGEGSGIGSGSGSGRGSGNGDGTGPGSGDDDAPTIPKKPVGPTEGIKILAKPQPRYTDAARQNNVQGTVTLKVTFLASGQIGGISPVSGLPNGLTEQAIAAARQIRFDPPKRNGVPYSVTKTVSYTFTIY